MNRLQESVFKQINDRFNCLTEMILRQISLTGELLNGASTQELRDELERNEQLIDAMEVAIRDEVISVIVLHAPRATNLRMIMASYDTTSNLERIGDLILNIDEFTQTDLSTSALYQTIQPLLLKMFDCAANMVKNAIFAIRCGDERLAMEVIHTDDQVDELWHRICDELETSVTESGTMLRIFGLANNLERIGDQATNIAEAVVYVAEGKDIKHAVKKPL